MTARAWGAEPPPAALHPHSLGLPAAVRGDQRIKGIIAAQDGVLTVADDVPGGLVGAAPLREQSVCRRPETGLRWSALQPPH